MRFGCTSRKESRRGGWEGGRVGCPGAMNSGSHCLSFVGIGVGMGEREAYVGENEYVW